MNLGRCTIDLKMCSLFVKHYCDLEIISLTVLYMCFEIQYI